MANKLEREWLIYSESKSSVICFVCRLFSSGKNNAFTDGFNDWKNVVSAIKSHEGSTDHRDCMIAWISRKTTTVGIEQAFQTQYEKNREY